MIRVAHVITQLELGGAQQNTLYTVRHLDRMRFEPFLICGTGGLLDEEAKQGPWKTIFISELVRLVHPIKDMQALVRLYRLFRQEKPQIVHTHSSKAGILGRIAAYVAGVPVIVHTAHGFGFTPRQWWPVRKFFQGLEWACARLSQGLIFVSQDNQAEAQRLRITGQTPDGVIHSGIDLAPTVPIGLKRELSLPDDAWIVVCVANFKAQKNPLDLVRVAEKLCVPESKAHLVLIGDGPLRALCESKVKAAGLEGRVHFSGWRADARAFVAAADAFLLTSLWEGLPRALVEAGAEGKPAVAYAVNGVNDLLKEGENGFPVLPGDWQAAAEKLAWLETHPSEARALGQAARKRVQGAFDIRQMVKEQEIFYANLYNRVPLKDVYELPSA